MIGNVSFWLLAEVINGFRKGLLCRGKADMAKHDTEISMTSSGGQSPASPYRQPFFVRSSEIQFLQGLLTYL